MRDGVLLSADLYRPEGEGPLPAVLCRTVYDKQQARYVEWVYPASPAAAMLPSSRIAAGATTRRGPGTRHSRGRANSLFSNGELSPAPPADEPPDSYTKRVGGLTTAQSAAWGEPAA